MQRRRHRGLLWIFLNDVICDGMCRSDVVQYNTGGLLQIIPSDIGTVIVDLYWELKTVY
jgi:hypothetical protein